MKFFCVVLLFFLLSLSSCLDHLWHSYQYDPNHKNREEIWISNITSSSNFKLNYLITKWKSVCLDSICYLAGSNRTNLLIVNLQEDDGFKENVYNIKFEGELIDFSLFQFWNSTTESSEAMIVISANQTLTWWKLTETNKSLFWTWNLIKTISHINIFQIGYDYHLLMVSEYSSQVTADLYEFSLENPPNFWLREKIPLSSLTLSSALLNVGPFHFLAIPQKTIETLFIYKLVDKHFITFQNITSRGIDNVVSFNIAHKSFLACNGLNAGIYRFNRNSFTKEEIEESNADGVNYWLPSHDTLLLAQRSLIHGNHKSFVIEIFTYNGERFSEHEDIPCFYYGEEILGLSCLPDEDGMKGSASILLNNKIGLIVPRRNRSSELFFLNVGLKFNRNPLNPHIEELLNQERHIQEVLKEQELRYVRLDSLNLAPQLDKIEKDVNLILNATSENVLEYKKIIFNGAVKVRTNGLFEDLELETINDKSAGDLLNDIVWKRNFQGTLKSPKTFKKLESKDVSTKTFNGHNVDDLIFENATTIAGDLSILKPLSIVNAQATQVNGLIFENEIINLNSNLDFLTFDKIQTGKVFSSDAINSIPANFRKEGNSFETLFLPQNIEVVNLNGENFNSFLTNLCLRNIPNYVPGETYIDGEVIIIENANVSTLNGLNFPDDYVFNDTSYTLITGSKKFLKNLTTFELTTDGMINGLQPSELITLGTDQDIEGVTSFENLKITESFYVQNNITGEHAKKFLPNPVLVDANVVRSKILFGDLEVEGNVVVEENFNGMNLAHKLGDILYGSEDTPVVEGVKQFPDGLTVRNNLKVISNSINNISLPLIVTKNTEQKLNVTKINGVVTFGKVEVQGLYNSFNVTKLDEELVKLKGEQYISSRLKFEKEVQANKCEIINEMKVAPIHLDITKYLKNSTLQIDNIIVENDLNGEVDNLDIESFDHRRLSYTLDQIIEGNSTINFSNVAHISIGTLNGNQARLFSSNNHKEELINKLTSGRVLIEDLYVEKSLKVDKINNQLALNLGGSFWCYGAKTYNVSKIVLQNNVFFNDLEIEKLSGVDFGEFVENIAFKNQTDVKLKGKKFFIKGLKVEKLIETNEINDIRVGNIFTKYGNQQFKGLLNIDGDVDFENDVTKIASIDGVAMEMITDTYQLNNNYHKIKGDVLFSRMPHIQNLQIKGYADDRKVQEFLNNLIYLDEDLQLNEVTFKNIVNVLNIQVNGTINNFNLSELIPNLLMITEDEDINTSIKFDSNLFIKKQLEVEKLQTRTLNDANLYNWAEKAIFVDRGFLKGSFHFDDVTIVDQLVTNYLNEINASTLIPLRNHQNLPDLAFNQVSLFNHVEIGNSTNFHNLQQDFENSILIDRDEKIESDVEFQGKVFIEGDLKLGNSVNQVDVKRIVTTNTNQELNASYAFHSKLNLQGNLLIDGLVNGISMENWDEMGLKVSHFDPQNITYAWNTENLIFVENLRGKGLINNVAVKQFSKEIEEKIMIKYQFEKGFIEDYLNLCKDLTYMTDKLKKQIYKFNYFEEFQEFNFHNEINYIHSFELNNNNYLIINEVGNCDSYLYILDSRYRYQRNLHFGYIAQIIDINSNNNNKYFIIRNRNVYSPCKYQGTNMWNFNDEIVTNIDDQDLLQESLKPGRFYGLKDKVVTEFQINFYLDSPIRKYRKWHLLEENMVFVPRGLQTGLALHTGKKLIRLNSHEPENNFDLESIIIGNWTEDYNTYLAKNSEFTILPVGGIKNNKRNLTAVASHEEASVKGSLDFIKIYEINGRMFHKVPTYKPSSLVSLEFKNGESLLVFLEDESVLQVYEYKGIEGFKRKLSVKLQANKLFTMAVNGKGGRRQMLGLIYKNQMSLMDVVMLGNVIEKSLKCFL